MLQILIVVIFIWLLILQSQCQKIEVTLEQLKKSLTNMQTNSISEIQQMQEIVENNIIENNIVENIELKQEKSVEYKEEKNIEIKQEKDYEKIFLGNNY